MNNKTDQSVADSLEVKKTILPFIPYLLKDLWVLGSSVNQILELIKELRLSGSSIRVLDLGCGKGAVSIQIATNYGFETLGIDAMKEFIDEALEKAEIFKVSHLSKFLRKDIVEYTRTKHLFDIVILASLGGIFGSFSETIKILRSQTKTDGYMIIDDGFLKFRTIFYRLGYEHYRNYSETIKELTSSGDTIIMELNTTEQTKIINKEYLELISKRCEEIKNKYPKMKDALNNYLNLQKEECKIIENDIEGRIWVIKKNVRV